MTRLTVHRRLQYGSVVRRRGGNYGTIGEFGADFLKKLSFYAISIHFLDFYLKIIDIAEAHARGFAPL